VSAASPFGSRPAVSPGFLLWRTTLRWQREVAAALKPLGLTHVQFVLLASVWWLSEQARTAADLPSQTQVATYAETDVMMTSSVLRTLESRGLVTRATDPADARVKRLAVTDEGRRRALHAVEVVEAVDAAFFDRARDREQVLDVLRQLADIPPEANP
jgi:DNA-binding MarR family transcriptional regulator